MADSGRADPSDYGLPARLKSLTDLQKIVPQNGLTATQNTEVMLYWLIEERKHPTPTHRGYGGGAISSPYIEVQLIKSLRAYGDLSVLNALASAPKADPNVREAVKLALGLKGDRRQTGEMLRILRNHPWEQYRGLAAKALGNMGDAAAIPALKKALADDPARYVRYSMEAPNDDTPASQIVYPVRELAEESIRRLTMEAPLLQSRARAARTAQIVSGLSKKPSPLNLAPWAVSAIHGPIPTPDPALERQPMK